MRKHLKQTTSTILAVALLGCAVMFSVSLAKEPYRRVSDNAFDGPPLGHPDKALISTHWIEDCDIEAAPVAQAAFDWGLPTDDACPKCGFQDTKVTPVVLDVPELLGPSDATAIEVIKRKLGINAFRGSIFEDPAPPTAQLFSQEVPPELKSHVCDSNCCSSAKSTAAVAECNPLNEMLGHGKTAIGATAVASPAVSAVSDQTCTAYVEVSAKNATCDGSGECSCAQAAQKNIGTPKDWLISTPRAESIATAIEDDAVLALRRASFALDETAKELEALDRYAEADALRQSAQELRLKARDLKGGSAGAQAASAITPPMHATSYWSGETASPSTFLYPVTDTSSPQPGDFQSPIGGVEGGE